MTVRETTITVPGGTVWVEIHGEDAPGIPLLLLHGGPGAPHDYLEPLAALANERPVIFYDQLGCGRSEKPGDRSLWTFERAVEELACVRGALGLGRLHLLGQSWGALLAAGYLLGKGMTGVTGLILSGPLLSASRWAADQRRLLEGFPDEMRQAVEEAERSGDYDAPAYQAAMQAYYRRHLCRLDPWPDCLNRTFEKMGLDVYMTMWGPSEFTVVGNLREVDIVPRLRALNLPTLITCGEFDEVLPDTAACYRQAIPGARLEVYGGASHVHHLERPGLYLAMVREFMGGAETMTT